MTKHFDEKESIVILVQIEYKFCQKVMKINFIVPPVLVSTGILVHQQYMNGHHMNPILHLSIKLFPYMLMALCIFIFTRYQERKNHLVEFREFR